MDIQDLPRRGSSISCSGQAMCLELSFSNPFFELSFSNPFARINGLRMERLQCLQRLSGWPVLGVACHVPNSHNKRFWPCYV